MGKVETRTLRERREALDACNLWVAFVLPMPHLKLMPTALTATSTSCAFMRAAAAAASSGWAARLASEPRGIGRIWSSSEAGATARLHSRVVEGPNLSSAAVLSMLNCNR